MIRIARLERKEDGNDEEDGAEESGAEETRRGPAARKNDDDREEDEGAGVVTSKKAAAVSVASKTKKGKSRRRDSHTSGRSGGGRVLAVDASSGRLPPRLLKAMIGPEGPLSALTRAHPDARSLAAEMVSSASASERRRGGARLHGRGMYVCPRVHCATRAAKAKALRRHLPREKKDRRKSGAGGGEERGGGGVRRGGCRRNTGAAASVEWRDVPAAVGAVGPPPQGLLQAEEGEREARAVRHDEDTRHLRQRGVRLGAQRAPRDQRARRGAPRLAHARLVRRAAGVRDRGAG